MLEDYEPIAKNTQKSIDEYIGEGEVVEIDGVPVSLDTEGNVTPSKSLMRKLVDEPGDENGCLEKLGWDRDSRNLRLYRKLRDDGYEVRYNLNKYGTAIVSMTVSV